MAFAVLLIFIGTMLLLSTFNLIEMTFGRLVMAFFAALFTYFGTRDMIRRGFPSGLTSLAIAVILILNVLGIFTTGFWQALLIIIAIALIQSGIGIIRALRRKQRVFKNSSGSDED